MEVETSLLEVRKPCQAMELLSYLGLNSVCKHPDFNSMHTEGMTCYFKGICYSKQSCISFEIQIPDNLEITFEEENILWFFR